MTLQRKAMSRRPSEAKTDFDIEYAKVRPSVLARGCEFYRYVEAYVIGHMAFAHDAKYPPGYTSECGGWERCHHAKGRRVADANDPGNLRCLCEAHHTFVHAHPRWSREVGLMLSRVAP